MTSISAGEALWESDEDYDARNEKYQRQIFLNPQLYPLNQQQLALESLNLLQNRVIQFVYGDGFSDYIVDSCICVRAPSDVFRQTRIDHWIDAKAVLKNVSWLTGVSAVAGAVGAVLSLANPLMVAVCVVTSAVSMIFLGIGLHKTAQASEQIALWSINPAEWVAEQRTAAYQKGFSYVYENNLKIGAQPSRTGVLHPNEVFYLYENYFPSFCSNLLSRGLDSKSQWMLEFLRVNPLNPQVITYAYGNIPPALQYVSHDFTQLQTILNDIQKYFTGLKADVRENANKTIELYNSKRNAALFPLVLARTHYTTAAKEERDQKLRNETDLGKRRQIQREFEAEEEKYRLFYHLAATPINLYFDNQIQETRVELNRILNEISSSESQNLAIYYPAARELLQRAYQVWTQPYTYQPLNFNQYNYYVPKPSAPSFDNLPNFQEHVPPPPANWNPSQQSEYEAYLHYFRTQ